MPTQSILLTGATGFVGQQILRQLPQDTRVFGRTKPARDCHFFAGELTANTDYRSALSGVDVVIHCAARAHVMNETANNAAQLYQEVNTLVTLALAEQAAAAGVKRFIFISTIKVNGEATIAGQLFRASDARQPLDHYGESKAKAEIGLFDIARKTEIEVVIIRPPLVYGPNVKANFATMLNLAKKNLPLPFGAIHNKRSMVALDNLVDLIVTCIEHPNAANQIFLVSDDQDVSTTELLKLMTGAAGKKPRLLPVPMAWLILAGKVTGNQAIIDRLCGNLQVDITHTKNTLSWQPPITVEEGVRRCFVKE
ncbi:SDR family oxidoreductase [Shewanella oneidensis MR-1]|uniref:NAD-dependent epimerase/dehydratase family protein n=1 Tax=Shewanella oneidensis (strain ATCC 700550 / JCM 31522 / CIP 106686 / LMG 19005 / NCIMB 14063 / MR-1) TaxID=211586 RepID=Q8ECG9_SHEON|nr:NAD-dependent epimerase/dehydratase family protein [Shewanella oneidensis]AAN56173.1 NAD-dependent epimerase/dehydratase family protein [Shewanella oneidensis MR-1]MDX5999396.1 SDR family oxidoreductase [Shewanella oneidensis]QKG97603.1 SDR family oxidoreductase [Shewanella oneidensis MR-1]